MANSSLPGGTEPPALLTPEARVARVSARKALPGLQAPWDLLLVGLLGVGGVGSGTDSAEDETGSATVGLGGGCTPLMRKREVGSPGCPAGESGPARRIAKRAPMRYWASWVSGGSSQMDVGASPTRALRPPHMRTGGVGCAGHSAAKRPARCRPGPRSLLGERERVGRAVRGSTGAGGSSGHLPLLAAQHSRKTFETHCASRGKAPDACRAAAGPTRPRRAMGGDRVAKELPSPTVALWEGKAPGEALCDRKLGWAEEP